MRLEEATQKLTIAYDKIKSLEAQLAMSKENANQLAQTIDEMIPELRQLNEYKKDMEIKNGKED